jgi:hypothetical protein
MKRLLLIGLLAFSPACYFELRTDGYIYACDNAIPFNGATITGCQSTGVKVTF